MSYFHKLKDKIHRKILLLKLKHLTKKLDFKIIMGLVLAIVLVLTTIVVALKSSSAIINTGIKTIVNIAGEELKTDSNNNTNFMMLGTGGKNHEGSNLTDSLIIASLDNDTKEITMLSIPRDLYIKNADLGSYKINEAFYRGTKQAPYETAKIEFGIKNIEKNIEDLMGIEVHYWAKINFEGLVQLIDEVGGVDVYVDETIYDPTYPKDGTFAFEAFRINKGEQHIDGATALKYARSRHTTSDFDRAKRQQKILTAFKDKALKKEVLLSVSKLTDLINVLGENIQTNMEIKEMITLAGIVKDTNKDKIYSKVLHDDPRYCGGLLYTPSREYYGGMFILLPAGGQEFIQKYMGLIFNYQTALNKRPKLQILNSSGTVGAATNTMQILKRFCFNTYRYGNGKDSMQEFTTYYYATKKDETGKITTPEPAIIKALQSVIPGKVSTDIPEEYIDYLYPNETQAQFENSDIILELGKDYTESFNYIQDPYYTLPDVKAYTANEPEDTVENSEAAE